ncbi:MAG: papain-like cysteine protease family protein [Phascolarctobacterium sp.]|nr:papain-like cysteine protease family protein [Phascolarctobacterium sp.]
MAGLWFLLHPEMLQQTMSVSPLAQSEDLREIPSADVPNSPYYKDVDVYHMGNTATRTILTNFATRQQRTNYTCGPVAAMMVADYFLRTTPYDEMAVAKIMGTKKFSGTDIAGMVAYFEKLGWQVTDSRKERSPETYRYFLHWVTNNLAKGTPIIVENVEMGGHWRVIIGYDTMGTAVEDDDVLIMADPYDTNDHKRDGYTINSAMRFYYMWFDTKILLKGEQTKPYIIAKPK